MWRIHTLFVLSPHRDKTKQRSMGDYLTKFIHDVSLEMQRKMSLVVFSSVVQAVPLFFFFSEFSLRTGSADRQSGDQTTDPIAPGDGIHDQTLYLSSSVVNCRKTERITWLESFFRVTECTMRKMKSFTSDILMGMLFFSSGGRT